jgi:pSer/pThr/pTyr-binding forkhead associated (FHA) protein
LLQGQTTLSVQIDSVTGKIDSLKVSVKEIKRLIERLQSFYGKESHVIGSKDEAFIIYRDDLNNLNKVKFKEVIIGRNEQTHKVELRFPDGNVKSLGIADPTVSRKHLRLNVIDSKIIITDLGSKNGTYINGARITSNTPYELKSEAKIKIGFNTEFELKIADSM